MDWDFYISCELSWGGFWDEIKRAFPEPTIKRLYPDRVFWAYPGFSITLKVEEDREGELSHFQVMKDVYGIMYSFHCNIEKFWSYKGDNLWEMMRFIGTIMKRVPGDAFLIFNGDEPVVYRHNGETFVDPGIWGVEGLGIPYQVGKWEYDFFLR